MTKIDEIDDETIRRLLGETGELPTSFKPGCIELDDGWHWQIVADNGFVRLDAEVFESAIDAALALTDFLLDEVGIEEWQFEYTGKLQ